MDPNATQISSTPQTPEAEAAALAAVQLAPGYAPLIRSWSDLNMWTTDEQRKAFEKWLRDLSPNRYDLSREPLVDLSWVSLYKSPRGYGRFVYKVVKEALEKGLARIPYSAVMQIVRDHWRQVGWGDKAADWVQKHLLTAYDLSRANLDFAGYKVAQAMQSNKQHVITAARAFGIRTDISDDNMAGALVSQIAEAATSQGLTIPQAVEIYGEVQVQGAGSTLSELWNDAKDWFNNTVTKNIGRALVWVAEQILKGRDNVPYLGTFFLDPLGISLLAETLRQVGEYARTGDAARSFNERVLGFELGTHWTALGQALIVAGGIIAQTGIGFPLGAIITAIGIILYAAGATILGEMRAREARSRKRAADEELKIMQRKLQAECAAKLEAQGMPRDQIPKDADKCVKAFEKTQQEKSEILSASQPAPQAGSKRALVLLTVLGVGYLLTRR